MLYSFHQRAGALKSTVSTFGSLRVQQQEVWVTKRLKLALGLETHQCGYTQAYNIFSYLHTCTYIHTEVLIGTVHRYVYVSIHLYIMHTYMHNHTQMHAQANKDINKCHQSIYLCITVHVGFCVLSRRKYKAGNAGWPPFGVSSPCTRWPRLPRQTPCPL